MLAESTAARKYTLTRLRQIQLVVRLRMRQILGGKVDIVKAASLEVHVSQIVGIKGDVELRHAGQERRAAVRQHRHRWRVKGQPSIDGALEKIEC